MPRLLTVWGFLASMGIRRPIFPLSQSNGVLQDYPYDEGKDSREREALVDEVVTKLEEYTTDRHLKGKILRSPKHIYSIFRKMQG